MYVCMYVHTSQQYACFVCCGTLKSTRADITCVQRLGGIVTNDQNARNKMNCQQAEGTVLSITTACAKCALVVQTQARAGEATPIGYSGPSIL
jgi:hypothetical protein